jgi:hypothetical protein
MSERHGFHACEAGQRQDTSEISAHRMMQLSRDSAAKEAEVVHRTHWVDSISCNSRFTLHTYLLSDRIQDAHMDQ